MAERLQYIDIAKGLLIIWVVFHHVINVSNGIGLATESLLWWQSTYLFYYCFFLQCFFVLTGMVSNFDKTCVSYLQSNVKGLLYPFLFFSILECFYRFAYGNEVFFLKQGGASVFFIFESFWFLSALFIAKVIYYFIRRVSSQIWLRFLLSIVCLTLSVVLDEKLGRDYANYFHYRNALVMVPFLCFGEFIKSFFVEKNKMLLIGVSSLYLIALLSFKIWGWPSTTPYSHMAYFEFSIIDIPRYLFYATSGSLLIITISWFIKSNNLLSDLGRLSLVIYGFHSMILSFIIRFFAMFWVPQSKISAGVLYLVIGILAVIVSALLGHYFMKSRFRILVGKS